VERARLENDRLVGRQRLFAAFPAIHSPHHFGARLALTNGYLFIAVGERDIRELAQELWTDHGKVIRLFDDGRVPPDNPFIGRPGARPGIWSYGHRNPQGLAFHPVTGALWETEHGPLGGDEVNVIKRGGNYGWPIVTFGREYEGHAINGGLTERAGLEPPVHHYSSSAALSGMLFYAGSAFPEWRNSLFVGLMTPRYVGRLWFEGSAARQEPLLLAERWRVRSICEGPDGFIYLGIERSSVTATDGKVVRIRPAG
jgi:aldose sugar dehydrogenase